MPILDELAIRRRLSRLSCKHGLTYRHGRDPPVGSEDAATDHDGHAAAAAELAIHE